MRYATVCSGIEAPSVAWPTWEPVFFSEIEPFPCAVLNSHYPSVPNLGDMAKYKEWPDAAVELICAGTPCQAFSVAGLRKGLDDPRGNLTLVFLGILRRYRPQWVVWENVPGVLSDKTGAFGAFLGGLGQLGYGFAYRVLDAQYFGVPQRRRRVFVVGCLGNWQCAAAVLFERHSLQGHTAPSRQAGQGFAADLAPSLTSSGRGVERTGESRGQDPVIAHSLRADGFDASEDGTGRGTPLVCGTLACNAGPRGHDAGNFHCNQAVDSGYVIPVAIAENQRGEVREMDQCPSLSVGGGKPGRGYPAIAYTLHGADKTVSTATPTDLAGSIRTKAPGSIENSSTTVALSPIAFQAKASAACQSPSFGEIAPTLDVGKAGSMATQFGMGVRRLTPRECERLQGFPDDYTLVEYRGKPASDGPRYKALGNSMAVPVVSWLGARIAAVNVLLPSAKSAVQE